MRGLEKLRDLVRPPASPAGAPFDWSAAESMLGTALPADYKAFCDTYGHGEFSNGWSWSPLTPFAQDRGYDVTSTFWRDISVDYERGMAMFPEPGGLLPFAICELKYGFWWRVAGPPDEWTTVLEDDGGTWHPYELTATELLAVALRDELFRPSYVIREVTFFSQPAWPRVRRPPFVISSYGVAAGVYHVDLDLAGALGGTRAQRLHELLAALDPSIGERLVGSEVMRSKEVLNVRADEDIAPVRGAVQAWADRVSGWA